jgi:ankyrin repeat protein
MTNLSGLFCIGLLLEVKMKSSNYSSAEGADVNATDGDGDTPLHLAGNTTASTEIAELLISKGADVNAMNLSPPGRRIGGMTPLDMATLGNRTETANLLRKHGGKTGEELKAEGK